MEIAITRSTASSADSWIGGVGTTVFGPEGKTGDGAGDTTTCAGFPGRVA
jgi:hypothetical protein